MIVDSSSGCEKPWPMDPAMINFSSPSRQTEARSSSRYPTKVEIWEVENGWPGVSKQPTLSFVRAVPYTYASQNDALRDVVDDPRVAMDANVFLIDEELDLLLEDLDGNEVEVAWADESLIRAGKGIVDGHGHSQGGFDHSKEKLTASVF